MTHLAAWILTALLALIWIALNTVASDMSAETVPEVAVTEELNGRMILGFHRLEPTTAGMLLPEVATWATGTPEQRLAYTVIVSELDSPEAAIEELEQIHEAIEDGELDVPEDYEALLEVVGLLLFSSAAGEQADELPADERALLERRLGIFGEVLHASARNDQEQQADVNSKLLRGALAFAGIAIWFLGMGFLGICVLILLGVYRLIGRLHMGFVEGSGTGSVYMETFAIWLFLFFGFTLGIQLVIPMILHFLDTQLGLPPLDDLTLVGGVASFFLSLLALVWPLVRGISWSQVRLDIGLTVGNPFKEICAGIATYSAALPLLLVGVIMYVVIAALIELVFGESPEPSHPIQDALGSGVLVTILLYIVACVAAPIVEETMFRGVLFRYLRDLSNSLGWYLSFAISALVSSVIFAMIHPQGLAFIPILSALAIAFCIGREWRGSLLAPMVAHGLSNAVVLTLNVVLAS